MLVTTTLVFVLALSTLDLPAQTPHTAPAIGDTRKLYGGFIHQWNGKEWVVVCDNVKGKKLKSCLGWKEWEAKHPVSDAESAARLAEIAADWKTAVEVGKLEREECMRIYQDLAASGKKVSDGTVQDAALRYCQDRGW